MNRSFALSLCLTVQMMYNHLYIFFIFGESIIFVTKSDIFGEINNFSYQNFIRCPLIILQVLLRYS